MQQSALRSLAIVCDYMETTLFAIVCDLLFAIPDRLRSSAIIWKPAFRLCLRGAIVQNLPQRWIELCDIYNEF